MSVENPSIMGPVLAKLGLGEAKRQEEKIQELIAIARKLDVQGVDHFLKENPTLNLNTEVADENPPKTRKTYPAMQATTVLRAVTRITPLHHPARLTILRSLLMAGASSTQLNADGYSATHEAALDGDADTLEIFAQEGGDMNVITMNGETPLHCVAKTRTKMSDDDRRKAIQFLLDNKANTNIADGNGDTALTAAIKRQGQYEMIGMLIPYTHITHKDRVAAQQDAPAKEMIENAFYEKARAAKMFMPASSPFSATGEGAEPIGPANAAQEFQRTSASFSRSSPKLPQRLYASASRFPFSAAAPAIRASVAAKAAHAGLRIASRGRGS